MNGMMFGGEGPIMQGTWYNTYTGDAFTVRDSFFEDNQYIVTTTDGRYLKYDQLQNYVQSDMKLEDLKKIKTEKSNNIVKDELPAEVAGLITSDDPYADMLIEDDLILTQPKLGNLYTENIKVYDMTGNTFTDNHVAQVGKGISMNTAIIEKALKNANKPDFELLLKWDDFPTKQIEMLKDIMEISENEILDWYLNNIDMMTVVEKLKDTVKTRILGENTTSTTNVIKTEQSNEKSNTVEKHKKPKTPKKTVTK